MYSLARTSPLLLLALSVSCAHRPTPIELVRFQDGASATGLVDLAARHIEVTLPDGEHFSGPFASVAEGNGAYLGLGGSDKPWSGLLLPLDRSLTCYAILTGDRGTVLEIDFIHDGQVGGEGFGKARTNTGEEYRLRTASRLARAGAKTKL